MLAATGRTLGLPKQPTMLAWLAVSQREKLFQETGWMVNVPEEDLRLSSHLHMHVSHVSRGRNTHARTYTHRHTHPYTDTVRAHLFQIQNVLFFYSALCMCVGISSVLPLPKAKVSSVENNIHCNLAFNADSKSETTEKSLKNG